MNSKPPIILFGIVACTFSDKLFRNICISFVANLWNLLEQRGWSTTNKSCLRDSLTSSRFYSLSINVWNSGYVRDIFPGGGGGGTPLYKLYRYVPPHRVGFLLRFGLKTLSLFRSGIGYGFRGNYGKVWTYLSFQFRMSKKEREICEFDWNGLDEFVCLRSNLSDDNKISA